MKSVQKTTYLVLISTICGLLWWMAWSGSPSDPVPTDLSPDAKRLKSPRGQDPVEERISIRPIESSSRQPEVDATPLADRSFADMLDQEVAEVRASFNGDVPGPGSKYGARDVARGRMLRRGGWSRTIAEAIEIGLQWLVAHQSPDGRFDCDGFMRMDTTGVPCQGSGAAAYDVGVTALVLLALLGDGHTVAAGKHSASARNAVVWLQSQQSNNGRIGNGAHHDFIYDHAIATYATCEAHGTSRIELLQSPAQRAIDYLEFHRHPQVAWGYAPNAANSDTSITIWALMAYRTARDFRLNVSDEAFDAAAKFLDSVTDHETGRVGYTRPGEPPSRRGKRIEFPPAKTESLTAIGLFSRLMLGHKKGEVMRRAADTILKQPIAWTPGAGNIDCYYWWFGSQSLYQMGGSHWSKWSRNLALVPKHQRQDGNAKGSWDPVGVWGTQGGRVATTALIVLTLETYYRLTRLVR